MQKYNFSLAKLFYFLNYRYFRRNNEFRGLVKNKKIAIVGPANYITKFNWGGIIDSYDLVVRVNRGIELVETQSRSIGKRTDILYNCLIEKIDNGGHISLRNLKKNNVKWVCAPLYSDIKGNVFENTLDPEIKLLTVLKLRYFLNLHIYDYKNYSILNNELKCRANTGFSAIFDLLENEAKEIYITGFSFYLDSFIKGYKKGSNKNEEDFANKCFNSIRHNQNNQWGYLKSKKNNPKFSFDPVLKEILNLKKLDKRKFIEIMNKYA